jgi:hypothetical protein
VELLKIYNHIPISTEVHHSSILSRRRFLISIMIASGTIILNPDKTLTIDSGASLGNTWPESWPTKSAPLVTDTKTRTVKIFSELSLKHLSEITPHWGIGFAGGSCAEKFIFISPVEPSLFYDALLSLNAKPGNNLNMDTNGAYTLGDEIKVSAIWPGLKKPLDISEIFFDSTGKGFNIRYGGNKPTSLKYKTGCLTCLESCPVGITSNASYPQISSFKRTIRPNSRFRGRPEVFPNKETFPVVVSYKLI